MAIDDLPLPVVNLLNVIAVPWPYKDEDVVSRFATLARDFATAVRTTHDDATVADEYAALREIAKAGGDPAEVPAFTQNPRFTSNPEAIAKAKTIYDGTYPG